MSLGVYETRRYGTVAFLVVAVAVVGLFLAFSNSLVKELSEQERARMQIWADATRQIINYVPAADAAADTGNFDFLLGIIEENRTIPVLLTDDSGNIINHRNFDLPEPVDSLNPLYISPANRAFLEKSSLSCAERPT